MAAGRMGPGFVGAAGMRGRSAIAAVLPAMRQIERERSFSRRRGFFTGGGDECYTAPGVPVQIMWPRGEQRHDFSWNTGATSTIVSGLPDRHIIGCYNAAANGVTHDLGVVLEVQFLEDSSSVG